VEPYTREFAHIGPTGDSGSDSGSINVLGDGCCWDRSDYKHVKKLASLYVHDDKLWPNYEAAREVTALMYEIGENGKLSGEEESVGCGKKGEEARTRRTQCDSSTPAPPKKRHRSRR
jgi:hypothetical protein